MKRKRNRRIERRKHVRTELRKLARISVKVVRGQKPAEWMDLEVQDVSEAGLRLRSDRELPKEEFQMILALSELAAGFTGELILPCRTAWSRRFSIHKWQCGLTFAASPESAVLFRKMLVDLVSPDISAESMGAVAPQ